MSKRITKKKTAKALTPEQAKRKIAEHNSTFVVLYLATNPGDRFASKEPVGMARVPCVGELLNHHNNNDGNADDGISADYRVVLVKHETHALDGMRGLIEADVYAIRVNIVDEISAVLPTTPWRKPGSTP